MDYSNPNFWQVVSIVAAVVIMLITLYIQRRKKSLVYTILTEAPLLSVDDEIKGKLQITLDGISVQNVHLILIKIWNNGNTPIATIDFEKPLKILLNDNVNILSAKVLDRKPKNLDPNLKIISQNQFAIEPLLLNKQDSFTIRFLAAEYISEIAVNARINGVKDIKRVSSIFASDRWKYSVIVLSLAIAIVIISFWIFPEWKSEGVEGIVILIVTALAGFIGILDALGTIASWRDIVRETSKK